MKRLANHIKRTAAGPMWHGPALREVLEGVTRDEALAHPIAGAHSIWELVHHVTAWTEIPRERLGGTWREPGPDDDFPPITDDSAEAWPRAVARLEQAFADLAAAARAFDEARLTEPFPGQKYSARDMLHGVIEHATYHGGQMALLKKALRG